MEDVVAFYKQVGGGGENRGRAGGVQCWAGMDRRSERSVSTPPGPWSGFVEARERDQMGRSVLATLASAGGDWGNGALVRGRRLPRLPSVRGSLSRAYAYGVAAVA